MEKFISHRSGIFHGSAHDRQQKKFDLLWKQTNQHKHSRTLSMCPIGVTNLSSKPLNTDEFSLLQKGLNFNIQRKPITSEFLIPKVEPALSKLSPETADIVRFRIANILQRQRPESSNLNKSELKALTQLKNDQTIHITRADKGNTTVILDKDEYNKKAIEHLRNGPYKEMTGQNSLAILNKFTARINSYLRTIKEKLGQSVWFHLHPKSNRPARFYGLPKIHKDGIPLRPIIDFTTNPAYRLAKFLNPIIKPLQNNMVSNIKDSFDFVTKLNHFMLADYETFVSFDITSLYTSVPVIAALSVIKDQ
ncbi:MAG: hypothetical protein ACRCTW_07105, partial [Lactococcus garvieae]